MARTGTFLLVALVGFGLAGVATLAWHFCDKSKKKRKQSPQTTSGTGESVPRSAPSRYHDIVLVYSESDFQLAKEICKALIDNVQIKDLKVAFYEDVIVGKPRTLSLFDHGNYIFVVLSQNYNGDPEAEFLGQMHLLNSLKNKDTNSRIIPVITQHDVSPPYLYVIQGLKYYRYKDDHREKGCFEAVEKLIVNGRTNKYVCH